VYYYRISPTNLDRTWDIGVVISIVEPAVHLITACAPATKALFRILFPSFNSEHQTYQERYTRSKPKFASRTIASKKRSSIGFNLGLPTKNIEEGHAVIIKERELDDSRGDYAYGMKPLGSVDSREQIEHDDYERGSQDAMTSKINTEYSKGNNDNIEAKPKHILGKVI
jgi:hypothetical protein